MQISHGIRVVSKHFQPIEPTTPPFPHLQSKRNNNILKISNA